MKILIFLALLTAVTCVKAEICLPHKVVDGDTFHFERESELVKVRVAGFDAPERGQPFSRVATAKLKELTQAGADCECFKTDKYKRSVCRVRVQGINIATLMLEAGLGCIDPRFANEDSANDQRLHAAALAAAQTQKRGMWTEDSPVCGKEYRDAKRAKR